MYVNTLITRTARGRKGQRKGKPKFLDVNLIASFWFLLLVLWGVHDGMCVVQVDFYRLFYLFYYFYM